MSKHDPASAVATDEERCAFKSAAYDGPCGGYRDDHGPGRDHFHPFVAPKATDDERLQKLYVGAMGFVLRNAMQKKDADKIAWSPTIASLPRSCIDELRTLLRTVERPARSKAVTTSTTVVQKCDGCDGLHEPYVSCDQVGRIDKRKEPSKAVAPHRISREQARKIADSGMCSETPWPDGCGNCNCHDDFIAALAAAGITVEEQS